MSRCAGPSACFRSSKSCTARHDRSRPRVLASELEISLRTDYRDVGDLIAQRVPIRGDARVGSLLDGDYDMPPLMVGADELEAVVPGAQWVAKRGDPGLAHDALDLVAKISVVIPNHLRLFVDNPGVSASLTRAASADRLNMARLRAAIRGGYKMRISYRDEDGCTSERYRLAGDGGLCRDGPAARGMVRIAASISPLPHRRVEAATFLDERFGRRPDDLRREWKRQFEAERAMRLR